MNLEQARTLLVESLKKWQSGDMHGWDVKGDAEWIEERLLVAEVLEIQTEVGGLHDVIDSVLNELTNADLQRTLPTDIPHLISLLESTDHATAMVAWKKYASSVIYEDRKSDSETYWN